MFHFALVLTPIAATSEVRPLQHQRDPYLKSIRDIKGKLIWQHRMGKGVNFAETHRIVFRFEYGFICLTKQTQVYVSPERKSVVCSQKTFNPKLVEAVCYKGRPVGIASYYSMFTFSSRVRRNDLKCKRRDGLQ